MSEAPHGRSCCSSHGLARLTDVAGQPLHDRPVVFERADRATLAVVDTQTANTDAGHAESLVTVRAAAGRYILRARYAIDVVSSVVECIMAETDVPYLIEP